ncbi:pilus assembly protein [Vibrio clamense]|uniref:TadE/TadG family type IV pilus assembly protein n=1 Tax=Vibrio TaxID=662 RepID=UPI000DE98A31|nr:pilus assembly protein [Vibrionales bacterium C3R12]
MKKSKGVASIEFVLGFMAFWLMCMAWVEMSYMSYVSAIGDLAVSEAARDSKTHDRDYMQAFQNSINKSDSLWAGVVDGSNFRLSIQYLGSVNDLENMVDPCVIPDGDNSQECGIAKDSSIAVYRIDYDFDSIFTYFMDSTSIFSREVIVIQEYERDSFEVK